MRTVLDANIYASALMNSQGSPALVLKHIISNLTFTLIISPSIIDELKRILFYPKVRTRINLNDDEIILWVESIQLVAHIIVPRFKYPILIPEDPADDQYLITALEGQANYIVSGDKHLLNLREHRSIKIVTATNFLYYNKIHQFHENVTAQIK